MRRITLIFTLLFVLFVSFAFPMESTTANENSFDLFDLSDLSDPVQMELAPLADLAMNKVSFRWYDVIDHAVPTTFESNSSSWQYFDHSDLDKNLRLGYRFRSTPAPTVRNGVFVAAVPAEL